MTMSQELTLKSFVVFMRAAQAVEEKIYQDIARYGINTSEFAVLELLYHKGRQTIQQIGKKVLLASGSMTYVLDKLEQKNLAKRENCPDDRRVIYAVLTNKGTSFIEDIFPQHQKVIEQIFEGLTDQEKHEFIHLVKKVGYQAKDH
ncbi:MarR family winged helix-turn-helix transcriptional regulator [Domibacillus sp. A3M-37]|uniref:MarR family winged helix-turn-helix transcriptional regulator n=1 Tax=Domibacillus sp. A3M-37 TaxID=2962037 RepID=UPI0035BFF2E4